MQELIRILRKCGHVHESYLNELSIVRSTQPKVIIAHMLVKSEFYEAQHNITKAFVFLYKKGTQVYQFLYSNNRKFHDDIIILCYLSQTLCRFRSQGKCEIVHTLAKLLSDKYNLEKKNMKRTNINVGMICGSKNPEFLTPFEISIYFPNISLLTFYYSNSSVPFDLLPSFHLPKIIFAPTILSILPMYVDNAPIAIFLAIFVRSDQLLKSQNSQTPLSTIYEHILRCYYCELLPESLKLQLCMKWKIVIKKKKIYKFASCFTAYRRKAKNLISELRPKGPNLKDILSRI